MTPNERRERGINKSTLWHQRKKLGLGENIKIYDKLFSKLGLREQTRSAPQHQFSTLEVYSAQFGIDRR